MANYVSTLTGPQMDAALLDMAEHNSEAWAVGTRDGSAVSSADVTYHNNAAYYADQANGAAARAEAAVPAGTEGAVMFSTAQTLSDAQKRQAQSNIGAIAVGGYNIVDNGWFTINQRGTASTSTSGAHIVDRWKVSQNLSATVNDDGSITLQPTASGNTYFVQDLPRGTLAVGEVYTVSLLVDGVIRSRDLTMRTSPGFSVLQPSISGVAVSIYQTGSVDRVAIRLTGGTSQTLNIKAVKVEKGYLSTLALDVPPNYATELLRCQRYLFVVNSRTGALSQVGPAIRWSSTTFRVTFPLPTHLYTTPTVSIDDVSALKLYWQSSTAYACTSMTSTNVNTLTAITITVTCSGVSSSAQVAQFAVQAGHILIVSAEL